MYLYSYLCVEIFDLCVFLFVISERRFFVFTNSDRFPAYYAHKCRFIWCCLYCTAKTLSCKLLMSKNILVFIAACAGMFLFGITLITLGSVATDLRSKFQLSGTDAGTLFSILPFGILTGSLVFGPVCDRYGINICSYLHVSECLPALKELLTVILIVF